MVRRIGKDALVRELAFDPIEVLARKKVIPDLPDEIALVERLALEVVTQAVRRHAGRVKHLYGPGGRMTDCG